jgi:hypothetical protein
MKIGKKFGYYPGVHMELIHEQNRGRKPHATVPLMNITVTAIDILAT